MSLLTTLAVGVILLSALYLLALGTASLAAPAHTSRFLLGFASTPLLHYAELIARLGVGAAFVHYAPNMRFASAFSLLGWVLLITTAVLLVVPWQCHRRFALRAVTSATRFITPIGVASLAFGAVVLFSVIYGQAT